MFWKEFYVYISKYIPHVLEGKSMKENMIKLNGIMIIVYLKMGEGKTGFPIVDAGMRELNETGYMHNKVD